MADLKLFHTNIASELIIAAKKELGETDSIKMDTISKLKMLINGEADFYPCMEERFLLRFLRARKFDVEKSFLLLRNYYKFKARHSGSITNLKTSDVASVLEEGHTILLDDGDHNNATVALVRIGLYDIEKFRPEDLLAFAFILLEIILEQEASQIFGLTIIEDCSNFSLRMVKHYAKPSLIYKMMSGLQDCMPIRVRAIHVINEPYYHTILLKLIRFFISEKLRKRIHFHGSDLQALHEHIPAAILPQEFGGIQGPMSDHAELLAKKVYSYENHVSRMNQYGYRNDTLERLLRKNHFR